MTSWKHEEEEGVTDGLCITDGTGWVTVLTDMGVGAGRA